jgi:hypothetical protein
MNASLRFFRILVFSAHLFLGWVAGAGARAFFEGSALAERRGGDCYSLDMYRYVGRVGGVVDVSVTVLWYILRQRKSKSATWCFLFIWFAMMLLIVLTLNWSVSVIRNVLPFGMLARSW